MADRDKKLSTYVTERRKNEVKSRAEDADMTVSAYINQLIAREMRREAEDDLSAETRAVEHLQEVIDRGTRQLRDATEDMREMQAKSGAYTIANFEFLKQQQSEAAIKDALSTGSRRLRDDDDLIPESADTGLKGEWGADKDDS